MDINFPLILMVATFATGIIALLDKLVFAPRRADRVALLTAQETDVELLEQASEEPVWIEQSKSFFPVLLVVFILRSFIVEPFQIPSGSMEPTLQVGDFILVSKFSYGLRMPVFRNKLVSINEPERGDVMVFFPPKDKRYFIKRVIGLPGDEIVVQSGKLIINGKEYLSEKVEGQLRKPSKLILEEDLDGNKHQIQWVQRVGARQQVFYDYGPSGRWLVPEGHYFMMGDNRGNSSDSRIWKFVPEENIVGKAVAVWMFWESWGSIPSFANNKWIE